MSSSYNLELSSLFSLPVQVTSAREEDALPAIPGLGPAATLEVRNFVATGEGDEDELCSQRAKAWKGGGLGNAKLLTSRFQAMRASYCDRKIWRLSAFFFRGRCSLKRVEAASRQREQLGMVGLRLFRWRIDV